MPTGIYPRTELHRERISKALLGNKRALGYKFTPEQLQQRYSHPVWRSEAFRSKISQALKGRPCSEETRRKLSEAHMGMRGVKARQPRSEESRHKMRIARSKFVIPCVDTQPEIILQEHLSALDITFLKHKTLPLLQDRKLRYHQFDLMLPELELLVEVDGCYWHACPQCRSKQSKPRDPTPIRELEKRLAREVKKVGWRVVRLWEHEIIANDFETLDKLLQRRK